MDFTANFVDAECKMLKKTATGHQLPDNSKSKDLLTQAAFARLLGVSKQSISNWKKRGDLVMKGSLVDAPASQKRLARFVSPLGSARRGAPRGAKISSSPGAAGLRDSADHKPGVGHGEDSAPSVGVSPDIADRLPVHLIANAQSAAWIVAMIFLQHHPIEAVRGFVIDLLLPDFYRDAFVTLDMLEIKPPPGFSAWREVEVAPPFFANGWEEMSGKAKAADHEAVSERRGGA